jgi:hypothetical protein
MGSHMSDDVKIAGNRTVRDWQQAKQTLVPGADPKSWGTAFHSYFEARLSTRYLKPIERLQTSRTLNGEGFSILAIHCSMIEFLESTLQGRSYRQCPKRNESPLGQFEYCKSSEIFSAFLAKRQPFCNVFDASLAADFYSGVRCGLLHEARTKDGWIVKAKGPAIVETTNGRKIVYRNNFQDALMSFIEWYRRALPADAALQEAFIRKFDSLCR